MPSIFTRSLIRIGKDAFCLVIPKAWIRYNKLIAGDRLEVIANDELIIRPVKKTKKNR